jgi:cobalt-zinc-cadmium efflux system outer membrane protein
MLFLRRAGLALVIVMSHEVRGVAQDGNTLTLDEVLALARERSPVVRAARARIEEARGRLRGASVRLGGNPVFEGNAGRRTAAGEEFAELEVGLTQGLGAAGRRAARMASAEAAVSSETATGEEVSRRNILDVADAFFRALHATDRLHLLKNSHEVAVEIARIAERRFQTGDVAILGVNVATVARARASSEVLSGEAELNETMGELRILLGMQAEEPLAVRGEMDRRPAYELSTLVEQAARRPDIRALAAQIEQADADIRVGKTFQRPALDVGVRYKEEENAKVVLGGLAVSLPVFDRGQGVTAEARARALRLRMEHDALRQAVETEVRTGFDVYQQRLEAVSALRVALPSLSESEDLVAKSYEAGQINLVDVLLVRRDVLETRISYIDRLLDAAVAEIRLEASAGVLR